MHKQKLYDLIVYIGRFQPFHAGHQATLKHASSLADHVMVLIGSAVAPRTIRNPWTYEERKYAIESNAHVIDLHIEGLLDSSYNDNAWITQVGEKINALAKTISPSKSGELKVAVIGHDKDHTSYYLNYFPQWEYIAMPAYPNVSEVINSTNIRELMFTNHSMYTDSAMPEDYGCNPVHDFIHTPEFENLQKEWNYYLEYPKRWGDGPFVTVDAVVEQSGHILLVERGEYPGKGLWAIPGGFVNPKEKLVDAVVRELREETRLKVPEKVLRGSIKHHDVFDDPDRSMRGRTFTHAYLFRLDDATALPKVKGGDDAAKAKWFSLAEFETMQGVMFEDHYSIIRNMLLTN